MPADPTSPAPPPVTLQDLIAQVLTRTPALSRFAGFKSLIALGGIAANVLVAYLPGLDESRRITLHSAVSAIVVAWLGSSAHEDASKAKAAASIASAVTTPPAAPAVEVTTPSVTANTANTANTTNTPAPAQWPAVSAAPWTPIVPPPPAPFTGPTHFPPHSP